jgi:perosamine synthetase
MTYSIPWAKPKFWGPELDYVSDALSSTWISGGKYVERLEREVATFCGISHALAVANGTVAIHLAYLAIGLRPGDEVVAPGFGYLAAANVALHLGAKPVFADVDPASWCVTADAIAKVLTPRTRAVVPIHTYGNACDMDPIMELCRDRGIIVIEDAAESFGTRYKGRQTGTIGDIGCYSFQATKTITTGEGGMVVTGHEELVDALQLYRSHGVRRTRYLHEVAGLNFRLTNMQAALGCAQLGCIGVIEKARQCMRERYYEHLAGIKGISLQEYTTDVEPVLWAIALKLDPAVFPQGRDLVIEQLSEMGIEARPGFYPPTAMPNLYGTPIEIPVCAEIGHHVISLPSYPALTSGDIQKVCTSLSSLRR